MSNERKTIMVSSTARDLPEHRKEVMDACLRQDMFPDMMEQLPASDANAIRVSLEMVDRADIYLGVFAHRYGYVPKENNPKQISITEMEYNRAVEKNIPRLIFIMHDDHAIKAADVETGEGAEKLKKFKNRIGTDRVAGFFKSALDLRAQVIQALVPYRASDITQIHYVSEIPKPPEAYIAHPYTLLQTSRLIGRQNELNLLTNWVTKKQEEIYWTHILNIVAIGGMGKSALTWKWFNDIAPQEMSPLAGRMWWSFYESDATFENFIIRALAYVSKQSIEEVKKTSPLEREEQLLQLLDREPYLFVLDGLERILIAYSRMDAARLSDDDIDERTANFVAKAYGLPESAAQSFVGQHLLRKTSDPRAGSFLRKLANTRSSRILVSTRLYPADLQSVTGEPVNGCSAIFLRGLNDDDALNLWRTFNVSGAREMLLPLFHKFENHPLLMQSLASEIANYRRAPGDFERWQKDHPKFDPFSLPLTQVKGHVLGFAMEGLYKNARKILETIAGFRMPAQYDTLATIFVGEGKVFPTELGLDQALKELEDRGLLGWDKRANRYDLHPIVRGVVWNRLSENTRNNVFTSLQVHFDSIPKENWDNIKSFDELSPIIELFNTMIGLGKYDDGYALYVKYLDLTMAFKFMNNRQRVELLEMLYPKGMENPVISKANDGSALLYLGSAYADIGQLKNAESLFRRSLVKSRDENDKSSLLIDLIYLTPVLRMSGAIRDSLSIALQSLEITRENNDLVHEHEVLIHLGVLFLTMGRTDDSSTTINRARIVLDKKIRQDKTDDKKISALVHIFSVIPFMAQQYIWSEKFTEALILTDKLFNLSNIFGAATEIPAARFAGEAALGLNELALADQYLHQALNLSRSANLVEQEIATLIALADLRRRQNKTKAARELLDDATEYAERGPYPFFQTNVFNISTQIERDMGYTEKAIEAATKAYRLAWCDGPPYTYHWGLEKAKQQLKELGAPEPEMPFFDESKFEPMVEVDINPKDEFWVDPNKAFDFDMDDFLEE